MDIVASLWPHHHFDHKAQSCVQLNDPDFNKKTSIPIEEFLKLVTLVLTKTWYLFDGKFFAQTDGVAMGGPAYSIIAEIYMQPHESTAIITADVRPKVRKRFVDDVFAIIKRSKLDYRPQKQQQMP